MGRKTAKIDESVLDRVREHVGLTGQTVSAFMNIAITKALDEIQGKRSIKTKYFSEMGDYLMKESNKKKK